MLHLLLHNAYVVIAFFAVFEGPLIAIGAGVGFALGYIDPYLAYVVILAGAFVQDVVYYWLGWWAAKAPKVREIATRTKLIRENFLPLEVSWRREMLVTLVLSKFAYGLYAPFVISAGLSAVPFRKFLAASMALAVFVIGFWFGLGYAFARLYGAGGHFGPYIAGGLAVAAFAGLFFLMRHARRHIDPRRAMRLSHFIDPQANRHAEQGERPATARPRGR